MTPATINKKNASEAAPGQLKPINATMTNRNGTRDNVSAFGKFNTLVFCELLGCKITVSSKRIHRNTLFGQRNPNLHRHMRICIYPGTFDPVTNGHLDVVSRAARIFDKVIIGVALNQDKKPLFNAEERLRLIEENLGAWPNVSATLFEGLLMDFARENKATALVRGLRAVSDFEFEFQMALMNRHLDPAIETIFLMPHESYSFTSSSLMKQVSKFGGNIGKFVPANVATALQKRAKNVAAIEPTTSKEQ